MDRPMARINVKPQEGQRWSIESAQAYYVQQIAYRLDAMTIREQRWSEIADRWQNDYLIAEAALNLMLHKDDVIATFDGAPSMRYSEFWERTRFAHGYGHGEQLRKAMERVDYVELRRAGSGFRVWLVQAATMLADAGD